VGRGVSVRDPSKKDKLRYRREITLQWHRTVIENPLELTVSFNIGVPKSWSKKKREKALSGDLLPASKPDLDNLLKLLLDAMNGLVYHDDALVCKVTATKQYSLIPHTQILVRSLPSLD